MDDGKFNQMKRVNKERKSNVVLKIFFSECQKERKNLEPESLSHISLVYVLCERRKRKFCMITSDKNSKCDLESLCAACYAIITLLSFYFLDTKK